MADLIGYLVALLGSIEFRRWAGTAFTAILQDLTYLSKTA
jgi:hypothetical protein